MYDLTDTTFTIPIRIDSQQRAENLSVVLRYLDHHFVTNIIILEAAPAQTLNQAAFGRFVSNIRYQYFKEERNAFHHTKYVNLMAREADTEIIVNYDADVLFRPDQYRMSVELLRQGSCDAILPYESRVLELPEQLKQAVAQRLSLDLFSEGDCTVLNETSWGGAIFWKKESFLRGGMENENIISWGPESEERVARFRKLGSNILRTKGVLFHLPHPRGPNSSPSHAHWVDNQREFERVSNMPAEQMPSYIRSFEWLSQSVPVQSESSVERTGQYCIKEDYVARKEYKYCDDRPYEDQFQDKVYARVKDFCVRNDVRSILEIGSGSGFKLMKYFSEYETLGREIEPTLSFLQEKYPDRNWELSDCDSPIERPFDLVMSIDVVEHFLDPDVLMKFIQSVDCKYVALGTPSREKLPPPGGVSGPPNNPHHIREWSTEEFRNDVSQYFNILEADVVSQIEHYVICTK